VKLITTAITLFFVLDPFGNLPLTLGLLSPVEPRRRWRVMLRESLIALAALLLFYIAGPKFIHILGVGDSDIRICGGALLGLIALRMVFPDERTSDHRKTDAEPFIVPLAIPLIAGPSALATVMVLATESSSRPWAGLGTMALAWLATTVVMLLGVRMGTRIPVRLLVAVERLSGLLLALIAVHMLMTGIHSYWTIGTSEAGL
jgi:multiple antibiotic resistance protein